MNAQQNKSIHFLYRLKHNFQKNNKPCKSKIKVPNHFKYSRLIGVIHGGLSLTIIFVFECQIYNYFRSCVKLASVWMANVWTNLWHFKTHFKTFQHSPTYYDCLASMPARQTESTFVLIAHLYLANVARATMTSIFSEHP